MLIRSVKTFLVASAFVLASALPAAAQTLGAGLSFLDGAIGATVDYSNPFRTLSNDKTLGWVGDLSFHRDSEGDDDIISANANWLSVQGGLRVRGNGGEKLRWHAQGLVGIARVSVSTDGALEDACEEITGFDCGVEGSDTGFVFTPGAGIDYMFDARRAFRAQLDLLIGEGGSSARFWVGLSFAVGQ